MVHYLAARWVIEQGRRRLTIPVLVTDRCALSLERDGWVIIADPWDEAAETDRSEQIEAVRRSDEGRYKGLWYG